MLADIDDPECGIQELGTQKKRKRVSRTASTETTKRDVRRRKATVDNFVAARFLQAQQDFNKLQQAGRILLKRK
jgi:hypothetical protein